jgi:hypothetical protein
MKGGIGGGACLTSREATSDKLRTLLPPWRRGTGRTSTPKEEGDKE